MPTNHVAAVAATAVLVVSIAAGLDAQARRRSAPAKGAPPAVLPVAEMTGKQAVIETAAGAIVIALMPEAAPHHVSYFITQARKGAYDGTTFHRAIANGIIQGGDPLSTDPGKKSLYGTGGLGILKAEFNKEPMTSGAVAAVLQPGKPDSAGAQFFILASDQPALQGQYTIFGRVVEGLDVVRRISQSPVDANGKLTDRIAMTKVTIRDAPPPEVPPFSTETVEQLSHMRVVLETTKGPITFAVDPQSAPMHVRNFLRLTSLGAYDGTRFHRIVKGFVVQGGMLDTRAEPLPDRIRRYVGLLQPEFNDTPHVKGTLSMARLDDPASASTSFFVCTGPAPSLDGKYTAFGQVVDGMAVVEAIEQVPLDGEKPRDRVEIVKARVETADAPAAREAISPP
jgi:cyclophilin family peptidyl-prolyl cis-trans isomerase